MNNLTDVKIDMPCQGCGHIMKTPLNDIIPGRVVTCPNCHATTEITGDNGRNVQRELNKLDRAFKKLCK